MQTLDAVCFLSPSFAVVMGSISKALLNRESHRSLCEGRQPTSELWYRYCSFFCFFSPTTYGRPCLRTILFNGRGRHKEGFHFALFWSLRAASAMSGMQLQNHRGALILGPISPRSIVDRSLQTPSPKTLEFSLLLESTSCDKFI